MNLTAQTKETAHYRKAVNGECHKDCFECANMNFVRDRATCSALSQDHNENIVREGNTCDLWRSMDEKPKEKTEETKPEEKKTEEIKTEERKTELRTIKIKINEVKINGGRRRIDQDVVKNIAQSITELGLINPITIDQLNYLVAGYHRLEACKSLGWSEIPANVMDGHATLQIDLAEIDENLVRNELTAMERSEHLARRKVIYEKLYPATKAATGKELVEKRWDTVAESATVSMPTFTKDTSEKTGQSERAIREEVQIAKSITPEVKDFVRETELADKKTALLEIAKTAPEKQMEIAKELASGKTVKEVKSEYQRFQEAAAKANAKLAEEYKNLPPIPAPPETWEEEEDFHDPDDNPKHVLTEEELALFDPASWETPLPESIPQKTKTEHIEDEPPALFHAAVGIFPQEFTDDDTAEELRAKLEKANADIKVLQTIVHNATMTNIALRKQLGYGPHIQEQNK